jgi:hypothetical protein
VRKPSFFAITLAGILVGCTSLLGDFDVGATAGNGDGGPCTECGGKCVDTATDSANCGACGTTCNNGQTCQSSKCACPPDQAFCNNQCTKADRQHCGATCAPCQSDEVCNAGCVPAPAPAFKTPPRDPVGWVGPNGDPLAIEVAPTNVIGTTYECRTGPDATFTPTDPAWGPCDDGPGTGTVHKPKPNPTTPEGTYRTEYRYRSDTFRSATIAVRYYVHHALDKVATCPRPNHAEDGPHFTDDKIFEVAQAFGVANAAVFPTTATFAAPGNPPSRNDENYLFNPFIKVTFRNVVVLPSLRSMPNWPPPGGDYILNARSLRHKYVMNPTRTLLLVRRQYAEVKTGACKDIYDIGDRISLEYGPADAKRGRHKIQCDALVLNARGVAVCVAPNTKGDPAVIDIDRHVAQPGNPGPGAATVVANSPIMTLAGVANANFLLNQYVQAPGSVAPGQGYWYKVVAVTQVGAQWNLQLNEPYRYASGTNLPYRYAGTTLVPVFHMPSGFAKLLDDSHLYALGLKAPGTPEPRTKCEKPGCNAGKPWLTYLPP